ncbi:hypothetical protein EST38_g6222 [Candolleomyces aberdarensis]|uniref:Protein kinase domain-containing protein n=1 Tax=Candolleomyces aberdarensis TaxID=2316362 RepID=A0A4Q2DKA1_9AGAR|nr:hypothetical protein EST38_g6222 [Candolleomyces aberdarensis]
MEGDEEDEDQEDEEEEGDSTDDYLLYSAQYSQLNRLKKGDLVRLYKVGNLPEDPELMTKAEIIQVILDARDEETASLPPSSPPGRSSDYSSDDGNVAGDEEEPSPGSLPSPLRRRVTMNTIVKSPPRPIKGRSMSLGNVLQSNANGTVPSLKRKGSLRINTDTLSKQRTSNRSSPSTSTAATSTVGRTFPFHQLRSRKVSAPTPVDVRTPTSANSKGKGKGKAKQVEFTDEVAPTKSGSSSKRHSKEKERDVQPAALDESDLTELDELPQLSPRRLRSKDREQPRSSQDSHHDPESTPTAKRTGKVRTQPRSSDEQGRTAHKPVRITPMRRAKGKIKSLRESDLEVPSQEEEGKEDEEDVEEESEEELEEAQQEEEEEEEEAEEPEDVDEENEVDELVSIASLTPPPPSKKARQTPMRQRLRQRRGNSCEANQGDDEYEEEEDETEPPDVDDDDEVTIAVEEPRRLRNGKVVGDEDIHMETADEIIEDDESGVDDEVEEDVEESDQAVEEEPDEDEAMEDDDVDLTAATTKSLTRLRKDDLVRLCESRNLEPVGNKRDLAEALLQWRDRYATGFSSPSSTGTVRPPSTTRRGRNTRSSASTVPVLLRSHQIHTDEPRTPAIPGKEKEEELELDLESLGLEDREIPPEKITKLEKIGSGGFKDVFIGKFKGRRIAIAEFRGTLSAMDIKELKLLGGFDHPNIVRFLGVSIPENTKETPVMIVSELCSNGDLFDYIRNVNAPSLHKVLRMMFDIASGLEYLHMRTPSVIHRDCKSSNILITAKGIAKIADFGLAKAPELWTAHPCYNHKVDVFSCAMVFWEMLQWHVPNKQFPWEGMNEHAIYDVVGAKKQRPSVSGLRKQWCPEVVDLIDRMWAQDPRDRPTMTEVVQSLRELVSRY